MNAGTILTGVDGAKIEIITKAVVGRVNALVVGTTEKKALIAIITVTMLGTAIINETVLADGMGALIFSADIVIITYFQVRGHNALVVHAEGAEAEVVAEAVAVQHAAWPRKQHVAADGIRARVLSADVAVIARIWVLLHHTLVIHTVVAKAGILWVAVLFHLTAVEDRQGQACPIARATTDFRSTDISIVALH